MDTPSAFVPSVAPLVLGSATASSWTSSRPIRRVSAPVSRRAVLRRTIVTAVAPLEIDGDEFDTEVLEADVPVLVDFYAEWCGPCKLVAPLMDWAASEFEGKLKVVKVDTEKHDRFVKDYNIHGLPTFVVFKKGEPFGIQEGAMGKALLEAYILKHAPEVM